MRITLCDVQPDIVDAWRRYLPQKLEGRVEVLRESIIHVKVDAVTSPANSFGFMDGGLDALYTQYFGPQLQQRLQRMIREQAAGELLWCISAPTMRVPRGLETAEPAYLGTRAAVRCALAAGLECVAIPGMGTGVGGLHPQRAARAMMHAIHDVLFPRSFPASLAEVYAF